MPHSAITISEGWKELLRSYVEEHFPDERLKERLAGESEARQMLDEKAGNMSPGEIKKFLSALNSDWWNGKTRHNRFGAAFGPLAFRIIESSEAFNVWSKKLWTAPENEIDSILNNFWDKNEVAGAGTSLPTAILYIRLPEKYVIWVPAMEQGVKAVCSTKLGKRRTAEGYRIFNDTVQIVRGELHAHHR